MSDALELAYRDRCAELIEFYSNRSGEDYTDRIGLFEVAARLHTVRNSETSDQSVVNSCVALIEEALADPHGDMFWMVPMSLVQGLGEGILPAALLQRMRASWTTYTPYRGDTENHWLMYYAAMLVMTELYPADGSASWFNGRSSVENREESRQYLRHWFRLVVHTGQSEFDSPHYLAMYLAPLALVYRFTSDIALRSDAGAMLDILIGDFAADSLNGLYVGAFSRIYPQPLIERARNPSTTFSWLLFGNIEFRPDPLNIVLPRTGYRPHAAAVVLAVSGYVPGRDLHRIATDRSEAYAHRELKRSRNHIRYAANRYAEVFKYTFACQEFAMGSASTRPAIPGNEQKEGSGLVQPIQQHSWEVIWSTDDAHDRFNMLFALHPYSDAFEMGLYFPEEPRTMTKLVISQEKPTYDSPDKWTGGSPYEQIFQHENCIVALYNIPTGNRYPFVSAFFSGTLGEIVEYEGWLVAKVAAVFVAYYPLAPFEWRSELDDNRRLHSASLKNGCIVQCVATTGYRDLSDFCRSLEKPVVKVVPVPAVSYRTLEGASINCCFGEVPEVDGVPVDYENWPVFDGPFMRSARGSGTVQLFDGTGASRIVTLS